MMVVDESDLLFKTANDNSKLELAVFGGEPIVLADSSHETLHGAFSSIMYVTATPQAMVPANVPVDGRKVAILEPEPSVTNWQFHTKDTWKCKTIDRADASDPEVMINNMVMDGSSRVALVSCTVLQNPPTKKHES